MMNGASAMHDSDAVGNAAGRQTFEWNLGAQARRIIAMDARIIGVDAVYGLLYLVISFFVILHPAQSKMAFATFIPFAALSLILIYYAIRVCNAEGDKKTAMFYSNLPRGRVLAYWTHALGLIVLAVIMESGIMLAMALGLGTAGNVSVQYIAPYMTVLPLLTIAFALWYIHARPRWFQGMPALIAIVFSPFWLALQSQYDPSAAAEIWGKYGPLLGIILVSALMLWHGYYRWKKTQIGEAS
jgi:hypothetical protein